MKKALLLSALLAAIWVVAMTGWSVAAHVTGAPGPTRVANAMFDASSAALDAADLPRPLATPRRVASKHLRTSRRIVLLALRGPERIGAAIATHWSGTTPPPAPPAVQLDVDVRVPERGIELPVVIRREIVIRRGSEPIRIIAPQAESSPSSH